MQRFNLYSFLSFRKMGSFLLFGFLALTISCTSPKQEKINAELQQLKAQTDSIETVLKTVDMKAVEDWRRFIDHRYRFFYKNYESLQTSDTLMSLLNDLEASKKMIGKMADQGNGLFDEMQYSKTQVTHLIQDYSNGLFVDSVAINYIESERLALEALGEKVKKRAVPMSYYLPLIDSIAPLLDSAMTYYEIKMN